MSDTVINIQNLSKIYKLYNQHIDRLKEAVNPFKKQYHRKFYALKNVDIQVKKGEILGIVGRNGAGKSTLLKIITGVLTPSGGKCTVNGRVSALLELGTGFNPDLTGMENIYFNGTIMGYSREEMESKVDDILSFAELGDFIGQPLKTYSSGMKSRLGFAVAINIDPEVLILDEVLAVGDELFKRKCYAKMEQLFQCGCTVLFVSHTLSTVNQMCSRSILIDNGEVILNGPSKMVTTFYQKYMFAKPRDAAVIRDEIIKLNQNEGKKKQYDLNEDIDEILPPETETNHTPPKAEKKGKQKPFFMPDFNVGDKVEYKNDDTQINNIRITTVDGQKVNALVMDETYYFHCNVKFNKSYSGVGFTLGIRTLKGVKVSSVRQKKKTERIDVSAGDEYNVQWAFTCRLLPQTYFASPSVSCTVDGETIILNAVADAVPFKVQPIPELRYAGLVHLNQEITIQKANK